MNRRSAPFAIALCAALPVAAAAVAQDTERATHAADASHPATAFEVAGDGWTLRQYQLGCLSHLSYLLVSGAEAAVVDPQRDVDFYIDDAARLGAKVVLVLLSHPHADFVAGHTELAARTGAAIAISTLAHAEFPHRGLDDRDHLRLGRIDIEAWATPGHTPNATTFLLRMPDRGTAPAFALTGDTLFVGSIGRPDLLDVPPAQLAAQSFDSVARLKTLPDATVVLPAHGAGSLCGAHLSPETTSTIGREKATNPYLRIDSKASFVANVISHQPVAPQYFAFNVELNRKGPPLVERSAELPPLVAGADAAARVAGGAWVVDLRSQQDYAQAHVRGAVNVALRGRLDTWTGIVVPFDADLLLVGSDDEAREGTFRLRRIGYDHVAGRLAADVDGWRAAGLDVRQSRLVTPRELFAAMQQHREPLILDVRTPDEYEDLRLGDVGNIPVTESARFAKVLTADTPIVMVCNSAYRSSMAVGLAERLGFTDVASLDGGLDAWIDAGLPTIGRMAQRGSNVPTVSAPAATAGSDPGAAVAGALSLPEPIDAAMLAKMLLEQPGRYVVIDLRPAWQFAEWTIPGAVNVAPEVLAAHVAQLPQTQRVVLVDRDGSHAFAVGGALMAHAPDRMLRVLLGGLQQYHHEVVLGIAGESVGVAPSPRPAVDDAVAHPAATSPGSAMPAALPQPKPAAKKRSAGC